MNPKKTEETLKGVIGDKQKLIDYLHSPADKLENRIIELDLILQVTIEPIGRDCKMNSV